MPAEMFALFVVVAIVLIGILFLIWRYWNNLADVTPEEEAFDKRVAMLNERQANRVSDEMLTRNIDEETAWSIMIERGRRSVRRRDRYSGKLDRRTNQRRRTR